MDYETPLEFIELISASVVVLELIEGKMPSHRV